MGRWGSGSGGRAGPSSCDGCGSYLAPFDQRNIAPHRQPSDLGVTLLQLRLAVRRAARLPGTHVQKDIRRLLLSNARLRVEMVRKLASLQRHRNVPSSSGHAFAHRPVFRDQFRGARRSDDDAALERFAPATPRPLRRMDLGSRLARRQRRAVRRSPFGIGAVSAGVIGAAGRDRSTVGAWAAPQT